MAPDDGPKYGVKNLDNLLSLLLGCVKSKTMFVAHSMGVFDTLHEKGPLSLVELNAAIPTPITGSLENFERLLNAGVGLGSLTLADGKYAASDLSKNFPANAAASWSGVIIEHNQREYDLFGDLEHCARTGTSCWEKVAKGDSNEMFDNTYNDKEGTKRFMHQMHSICLTEAHGVMSAYDLSKYPVICDVGGCSGTLAIKACELYPNVKGIVLDLPSVVEIAQEHFSGPPYINSESVKERISYISGDFFTSPEKLPDADLVILSHILHDWEDARAEAVLEAVCKALHPGATLLISESLLNDDYGPFLPSFMDLIMLVRGPGRERTFKEFKQMLEKVGFSNVEFRGPFGATNAILAVKAAA